MSLGLLSQLDLNVLVALDVLLEEESVTRAASRLHVTQPAMSQTLRRLRELFDDPLLVRVGGRMKRTAKAQYLMVPLRAALRQLTAVLMEEPHFVPEKASMIFRIAALDHATTVFIPGVVSRLQRQAPGVELQVLPIPPHRTFAAMEAGEVDLSVGLFPVLPGHIKGMILHREHFLSLVCAKHPLIKQFGPDLLSCAGGVGEAQKERAWVEAFASYPHGLVSTTGEGEGVVDRILREHGLRRRVAVKVPYFQVVPMALPGTTLIFTLPAQAVLRMAQNPALAVFVPPIEIPTFAVEMIWAERIEGSPAHVWFRTLVEETVKSSLLPGPGVTQAALQIS